tara:strand:- start:712 stop:900 length:189 start_codon:yes stop_codon:yes gene_type:complete
MKIEEFNKTSFGSGMRCIFKMETRVISSLNFDQALIGLKENCDGCDEGDVEWVRCENIELTK